MVSDKSGVVPFECRKAYVMQILCLLIFHYRMQDPLPIV